LLDYNAKLLKLDECDLVAKKKRARTSRKRVSINVNKQTVVSGISQTSRDARCCLVLAHGAGAGMEHPFMRAMADGLLERSVATLRYQFPYMEKGSRRPDPPTLCHQTVRAAALKAHALMPSLPLIAGGKSFGGRMTSQAQATSPLPLVRGLCFLGFPLHAPKKIPTTRAEHLSSIHIPMLFVQGTRDALANWDLMASAISRLGATATLVSIDPADHSFHVPVRSGRTDAEVMQEVLDAIEKWSSSIIGKH
jgi:predicted alpha/beta-hydrolase family hydrolase